MECGGRDALRNIRPAFAEFMYASKSHALLHGSLKLMRMGIWASSTSASLCSARESVLLAIEATDWGRRPPTDRAASHPLQRCSGIAASKSIGAYLIHVVLTRLARADRGLDRLDLGDVDDGLLSVAADSVHGALT
jgi:hypothetical protein